MKKIILLIVLIPFFKHLQAQTKEETITWIAEKITKYGSVDVSSQYSGTHKMIESTSIDNNIVTSEICITFTFNSGSKEEVNCNSDHLINLTDIIKVSSDFSQFLKVYTNGLKVKWKTKDETTNSNQFNFTLNWDAEPDLYNRFYKALLKLASYNSANLPKEVF
jgi:hypothetical protein